MHGATIRFIRRYMLCGGVAACHRYGVCVLAACLMYGVCTGSMSWVWCVYWQHVIGMVCVLAACHRCGVCAGSMS